jgi:hypothetical protein
MDQDVDVHERTVYVSKNFEFYEFKVDYPKIQMRLI